MLGSLRCPESGLGLRRENGELVSLDGRHHYPLTASGIPQFAQHPRRTDSRVQQAHYDRIAPKFVRNLAYPHTEEYAAFLDRVVLESIGPGPLGVIAEICCGRGEAIRLIRRHRAAESAMGVDISGAMLEAARRDLGETLLVQGDATALPIADEAVDDVFVFGGIHHVNDREALFGETRGWW